MSIFTLKAAIVTGFVWDGHQDTLEEIISHLLPVAQFSIEMDNETHEINIIRLKEKRPTKVTAIIGDVIYKKYDGIIRVMSAHKFIELYSHVDIYLEEPKPVGEAVQSAKIENTEGCIGEGEKLAQIWTPINSIRMALSECILTDSDRISLHKLNEQMEKEFIFNVEMVSFSMKILELEIGDYRIGVYDVHDVLANGDNSKPFVSYDFHVTEQIKKNLKEIK